MTSSLLARKGSAEPSFIAIEPKASFNWQDGERVEDHGPTEAHQDHVQSRPDPEPFSLGSFAAAHLAAHSAHHGSLHLGEKRHRLSIALSAQEFEKLGIVAVKKSVSRQLLLRLAIDLYLEKLRSEYRADCACVATGEGCSGSCSSD
jgi:hypothetical protein